MEKLKTGTLVGKLWDSDTNKCLGEEISLRLVKDEKTTNYGVGSIGQEEFYIEKFIYEKLEKNGRVLEARYCGGCKMTIINYEKEKEKFRFHMKDLGLI